MTLSSLPFQPDVDLLEEAKQHYIQDAFAFDTIGMTIEAMAKGHAYVSMPLGEHLSNAKGNVQGGALFSLADLTGALADYDPSYINTTVEGSIQYLSVPKGEAIYAHAYRLKSGRNLGYYRVDMYDETERIVAAATFTYFHLSKQ